MATTDLIFSLTDQAFIQSVQQPNVLNTFSWYYGSVRHIRVKFAERSSAQQVSVPNPVGWAVQMAIGAVAGPTVATSATATGPDSEDYFTFTVLLNVAGVLTALGSGSEVALVLEFQITSVSGEPEKYQTAIKIKKGLITTTLVDPVPPETAMGSSEARALFVPRDGSNTSYPCDSFIMEDANNSSLRYLVSIKDGQWHFDRL